MSEDDERIARYAQAIMDRDREIAALKRQLDCGKAFHDVAVAERDHARFTVKSLQSELATVKAELAAKDECAAVLREWQDVIKGPLDNNWWGRTNAVQRRAEKALAALGSQPEGSQEAAGADCRNDGRCQYAIDHGAEGLGHCPKGKCVMPKEGG